MEKKKKVLIIYATAGIGHAKAAFAIKKAFDEARSAGVEVALIDSLDYMTSYFRKSYLSFYLLMINRLSNVWGFFYFLTNIFYANIPVAIARRYMNWLHSRNFVKFLLETKPDVVLSTHFLANEVISNLKSKGLLDTKLVTVVTDYRMHAFWVAKHIDLYVVGSEEARDDLKVYGVGPDRVRVLGIPVEPAFTKRADKEALSGRIGLEKGRLTILAVGGGFGVGPIEKIVRILDAVGGNIQALVVCGYNEALRRRVEGLKRDIKWPLIVYGFVSNMYELMQVSDLLVSKSGGLTSTEAMVEGLPIVAISPIPGQESRNCAYLVSRGAAVKIKALNGLKTVLKGFIEEPSKLQDMREAIKRTAKPNAVYDIVKLAAEL